LLYAYFAKDFFENFNVIYIFLILTIIFKNRDMTNKIMLIFAAMLLLAAPVSAQDLLDKLADYSCNCLSQKNLDNASTEEIQMQMGFCIMEAVGKYPDEFQKAYGSLDPSDQAAMTKLGEDIGMKMAFKCPNTLMKLAVMETQTTTTSTVTTVSTLKGTLKAVEGDDFSQLVIRDEAGRTHKLLWLEYFNGSERLISSPEKAIGRQVTVQYETIECYSPKVNDYINCKAVKEVTYQ
jgi:hypothetical protein